MDNLINENVVFQQQVYTQDEIQEAQKRQREDLYKDIDKHRTLNTYMIQAYLEIESRSYSDKYKKGVYDKLGKLVKDAITGKLKEDAILSKLAANNDKKYYAYKQLVEKSRAQRGQAKMLLEAQLAKIDSITKQTLEDLKKSTADRIKQSEIITNLSIDLKECTASFSCSKCGEENHVAYSSMPMLQYGYKVKGIPLGYKDPVKRLKIPTFECGKCGAVHIFPASALAKIYEYSKEYLLKYHAGKSYTSPNERTRLSEDGVVYLLNKELYATCSKFELVAPTNYSQEEDKMELGSYINEIKDKEENATITNNVLAKTKGLMKEISNKDIEQKQEPQALNPKLIEDSIQDDIRNNVMRDKIKPELLEYENNTFYEKYETEDLDSLTVEELTTNYKYYNRIIILLMNDLDPEKFLNKDTVDILSTILSTPEELDACPKAIKDEINDRYEMFVEVTSENFFDII